MLRSAMALRPLQPLWRSATGTIPRVSPAATQLLRRTAGSEAAQVRLRKLSQLSCHFNDLPPLSLCPQTQETKPTTPETASETEALRKQVDRSLLRQLRFDEYMRIKRLHKRIGYAVAVPGYFTGAFVASAVCIDKLPPLFPTTPEEVQLVMYVEPCAPQNHEPHLPSLPHLPTAYRGMEPLVVAAIACTATGIVFALGGAALYNALWRMLNKDLTKLMDAVRRGGEDGACAYAPGLTCVLALFFSFY